jgi:hypothetical protein
MIDKDLSAHLVVSIGGYKQGKIAKASYDLAGTISIDSPVSLHTANDDLEITLLLSDDLNSIEIIASGTNPRATGYLRKINTASDRPYHDFTQVSGNLQPLLSNDLALPGEIEMTNPDPSLPDSLKVFAGVWEGKLSDGTDTAIFVKKITDTDAEILVSWGSSLSTPKRFMNLVGQVAMNDVPEIQANNAYGMKFIMIPGSSGRTAEARYLFRWYNFSSVYLHKRS